MYCRTAREDAKCVINFIRWLKQEVIVSRARKMDADWKEETEVGIISKTENWYGFLNKTTEKDRETISIPPSAKPFSKSIK